MTHRTNAVATGSEVLDQMLGGGLPANRTTLVTGGPGTGKSTFGMQFLQAGLAAGETGLYISTEQTIDEIQQSFAEFEFDLSADGLAMTTIHATPGQTIEQEEALTLETFEDSESPLGEYGIPFTVEYIKDHIDKFAPVDRIVFDSTSGLEALAEEPTRFRRTILDLIRFFSDKLEATTLLTAEEHGEGGVESEILQFTTHGVIRFSYTTVSSDRHRSLEIMKMRGVDHDHRRVEVQFTEQGIRLGPRRRSQPPALKTHAHQPIGIDGLDSLTGGGLVTGAGVLLEYDSQVNLNALLGRLLTFGIETERPVLLVPTIELRQAQIERLLRTSECDLDDMLADGQLIVIDLIGTWDESQPNVYGNLSDVDGYTSLLRRVAEDHDQDNLLGLINANALIHSFGSDGARRIRYFTESQVIDEQDMVIHVMNPDVLEKTSSAFYRDTAEQVLRTWTNEEGLQYLTLEKSPCGFVGSTSLVEYTTTPPYLRVQAPPQTRTNPYAEQE